MSLPAQKHVFEQEFALSRHRVWELLSNTDHLNRVIGLFPIRTKSFRFQTTDFIQELTAKVAGVVPMKWQEHPFQWVRNERYDVVREYRGGPLKRFFGGIELRDAETVLSDGSRATIVKLFAEFTPANAAGIVAIPIVGISSMRNTMKYLHSCVKLAGQEKEYLLPQPKSNFVVNNTELELLLSGLGQGFEDSRMLLCFKEHLKASGDDEVVDMRPYELAARWGVDREAVLRLFLYATKLGLTNLSWHLICPNCRVPKAGAVTMSGLQPQYHCDFCGINYEAAFDRYVELCFSVHPNIRRAYKQIFCIGGPMITPHIHVQLEIPAGSSKTIFYPDVKEELRLRVLRSNHTLYFQQENKEGLEDGSPFQEPLFDGSNSTTEDETLLHYDGSQWSFLALQMPKPGSALKLVNKSSSAIIAVLENCSWKDAVTASKVTAMHEFRSMFSSEVLAPGQQVSIESVTLLFSDLLGSTAFYEHVGDAHAYGQVRKHFDFLQEWVNRNKGTIVKTIGDAVMAVFEYPENAVKAAMDIQTHVDEFNKNFPSETPIVIKIGLQHGPAIVVNSNHILDYFGRTVNLASRTQGLSVGRDIIVSRECVERLGVRALLDTYPSNVELFEQTLKGIEGVLQLARICVLKSDEHSTNADAEQEGVASADVLF
ncbi:MULTISPECIES: adenylate/guanylate cyclase domain-containing protein [unclassified Paenibacillus]|uniref:adenylate/guanylate cyclase domain-containing protein n=1 Tax=unclassified Paenibacillus TaxID=185978 RepID=UPI003632BDB7